MNMETFIHLASKWSDLGDVVQEQMIAVLDDSDTMHEQNPNALQLIRCELLKDMINSGDHELARDARGLRDLIDGDGCDHEWKEQEGEPPVDVCVRCGKERR
jgi:hypothetical protein